jgi:hypothetical protein
MSPTDKLEMQVAEDTDGSATVILPQEIDAHDATTAPTMHSESQNGDDEGSPPQQNDGLDNDPDREAIRAARREERRLKKQIHREKARESSHLVSALKQQNSALAERLAVLEQKTSGAELARIDKAIEDSGVEVEYAKMKMQNAVRDRDGEGVTKAQERWFEAQRKMEALQNIKQRATQSMSQPRQNASIPDPMVQRMASEWMEENAWYDPQGQNEESQIAQVIDKRLTNEGYDPSSQDYWDELTDRMKKYIPASKNSGYNDPHIRNQRPKSVMTSSGRETTATTKSNEFRLSPQRVTAMKEAGLWDNPTARQNAIRKYAEWDRTNKQQRA